LRSFPHVPPTPTSTLFPYTTLFRSLYGTLIPCRHAISRFKKLRAGKIINLSGGGATNPLPNISAYAASKAAVVRLTETLAEELRDRKSTRLNSSHLGISYAVFCLKK